MQNGVLSEVLAHGNERFSEKNPPESLERHLAGQKPHTAILCCSDSRVPPEIIFDSGIGDIFIVRVAGNVALDPTVLESLEYAVEHLKVRHLIVLGHTNCGAVKAAMDGVNGITFYEIRSCGTNGDVVCSNVKRQVSLIPSRSVVIKRALEDGRLKLVGAVYSLEEGRVTLV